MNLNVPPKSTRTEADSIATIAARVVAALEASPPLDDWKLEAEMRQLTETNPRVVHGIPTTWNAVRVRWGAGDAFWAALADLYKALHT